MPKIEKRCNCTMSDEVPNPYDTVTAIRLFCSHRDNGWRVVSEVPEEVVPEFLRESMPLMMFATRLMEVMGIQDDRHVLGMGFRTTNSGDIYIVRNPEFDSGISILWSACPEMMISESDVKEFPYRVDVTSIPVFHYGADLMGVGYKWVSDAIQRGDFPDLNG